MAENLKKIEYKIEKVEVLKFYENNPEDYKLEKSQYSSSDVDIGFGLRVNDVNETIDIILSTVFNSNDEKKIKLFSLDSLFRFKILNFKSSIVKTDKNNYKIPDNFLYIMLETSLSGARGMIVPLVTIPEYKHLLLPLINPMNLIKRIKK